MKERKNKNQKRRKSKIRGSIPPIKIDKDATEKEIRRAEAQYKYRY